MTDQKPRTFADMTPNEIDQCRGMWCEVDTGGVALFLGEDDDWLLPPGVAIAVLNGELVNPHMSKLTPRFDLPRAWNPDGTPPKGTWEYDTTELKGYIKEHARTITNRRWVSDWEAVE